MVYSPPLEQNALINLECEERLLWSKPKALRRQGFVIGVVYGKILQASIPLIIQESEVKLLIKKLNNNNKALISLNIPEIWQGQVQLQERQIHPVTKNILHLSFLALTKTDITEQLEQNSELYTFYKNSENETDNTYPTKSENMAESKIKLRILKDILAPRFPEMVEVDPQVKFGPSQKKLFELYRIREKVEEADLNSLPREFRFIYHLEAGKKFPFERVLVIVTDEQGNLESIIESK